MSSIPENSYRGMLPANFKTQDTQQASSSRQSRQMSAYEALDTGLTIKTREGDIVTLSSSSRSQFDSYQQSRQSMLKSNEGTALTGTHLRRITRFSGQSFSFAVQGDLNEQELTDIDAIVTGIDQIASEVSQGNMEDAMAKALSMGSYDSVSMYSADISYARGYSVIEQTGGASYLQDDPFVEGANPGLDGLGDNIGSPGRPGGGMDLFERMMKQLEGQEDKLLAKARKPIGSLFRNHLKDLEKQDQKDSPEYSFLAAAGKRLDQMIADRVKGSFGERLNLLG